MSDHSKTPWAFETQTSFSHIVHGPNSESVCDVIDVCDAEFIVRACNAHDELVEAFDALVSQIAKNDFRDSHGHDAKMLKAFIDAQAALAKQEESP